MLDLVQLDALFASAILLITLSLFTNFSRRHHKRYPPGPRRLPLVGNFFDMPATEGWITYKKWSDESGCDVVHADVLGSHVVILNSAKAANELLEKRSSVYSDRPRFTAFHVHVFLPYGDRWRRLRRAFNYHFDAKTSKEYRPLEMQAVQLLLRNLLSGPDNFSQHLRHWLPGASFKREAQKWLPVAESMMETPHAEVKAALAAGTATPSVTASMISQLGEGPTEDDIWVTKAVPGAMYLAGSDTTVAALSTFFLAMTLYPEVQRKAQAEVDSVTCGSRLPDFSDFDELPYVDAVLNEVLRWHPVTPLGVAHRVMENDVYEGHLIPAGSTVIPNVWAIMRDPVTFPEPNRFYPERWLVKDPPPAPEAAFGYGRRICQGRFMARENTWAAIVNILATFDISPVKDNPPQEVYTSGIISYPETLVAYIHPRSDTAAALVRATGIESA
ncbi:cytochrome P450 [Multifurca ochricompacta]|uniref:Cytochrome P450 n=1 Tax=Multifurca ochricompacta TaxID=376703 RepID=A0AAD4LZ24_9AGAM|nr:cytochrome P450 [Multifurca ochricompacta]